MTTITQLKTELREFIELSETIPEKSWQLSYFPDDSRESISVVSGGLTICNYWSQGGNTTNATFIARSRNISPTMAKMLLVAVEGLERLYDDTEGYADGAPDASGHDRLCNEVSHAAKHQLNKLLKLWEETK